MIQELELDLSYAGMTSLSAVPPVGSIQAMHQNFSQLTQSMIQREPLNGPALVESSSGYATPLTNSSGFMGYPTNGNLPSPPLELPEENSIVSK